MPREETVSVQEITSDRDRIIGADKPLPPDLGGRHNSEAARAEARIQAITSEMRIQQKRVFELIWNGSRVPTGAEILGKKIAATRHGIVTGDDGEVMGSYKRIEDCSGPEDKQQRMHVYLNPPILLEGADKAV